MKWSSLFTKVLFVVLLATAGLAGMANAVIYTWDVLPGTVDPGNGQIDDGPGTWDAADANNWTIDGGANNIKWTDGSDAVFGTGAAGTAGVVTIAGTVSTPSVTFNKAFDDTSYSLTGGTLTLTGTATVTTDGATNDIASNITGAVGLTKAGAGILTLSGASNDYTGMTTINLGTLALSGTGALGTSGNDLTLAAGSLDMGGASQTVGAVDIQAAGVIGNGGTLDASSMTKSITGTGQLSALTAVSGATTVTGGTLQYSASGTTGAIVIDGGDITIDDDVTLTNSGSYTFSTNNEIKPTGTTGYLAAGSETATFSITVDPGVTGTISANLGPTSTTSNNPLTVGGGGHLVLAGAYNAISGASWKELGSVITVDGGSTLEVTGWLSVINRVYDQGYNSAPDNGGMSPVNIGSTSANNTFSITGAGRVQSGTIYVGTGAFGYNHLVVSSPGTSFLDTTPTDASQTLMYGENGNQIILGGTGTGTSTSTHNTMTISNGAVVAVRCSGGGTGDLIGQAPGSDYNSVLITGTGSTWDFYDGAGVYTTIGGAGNYNVVTIENNGRMYRKKTGIGYGSPGDTAPGGSYNGIYATTGGTFWAGSSTNSQTRIGVVSGATYNYLKADNGGILKINGTGTNASQGLMVGEAAGADYNYVSVSGTTTVMNVSTANPITIGGTPTEVDGGTGNHLDVYDGATLNAGTYTDGTTYINHPSIYVLGTDSAVNLGDGTSNTAQIIVGATTGKVAGVYLKNASGSLNINNGRLTAGANGELVSGPGRVNLDGPAYVSVPESTAPYLITCDIAGTGSLTKEGEGALALTGITGYTGDTIVSKGSLLVENTGAAGLDDAASVWISVGAVMELNFSGTDTIGELYLDGVTQGSGTYDKDTPGGWFANTGSGKLVVGSGIIPGDTNDDGVVDAADFIALKKNFGTLTGATEAQGNFNTDVDGAVNWADLSILMDSMTPSASAPSSAPEPATLGLLALGALAVIRRRRRS